MQMFTDVVVAIDGSKFKAVNSKPNNFTSQKAKDHIERVEQSITYYLNKLDEADKNTEPDANTKLTATKLAWLKSVYVSFRRSNKQSHNSQINNSL